MTLSKNEIFCTTCTCDNFSAAHSQSLQLTVDGMSNILQLTINIFTYQ